MRLTLVQGLLKNLDGEIPPRARREYLPVEVAYEKLKELTGEDFGLDEQRWKQWFAEQRKHGKNAGQRPDLR